MDEGSMSLETDFADFEAAITRVSREYDAFLFGSHGRLPAESRRQLESMARALSSQRLESASERYRFNTLIGRYTSQLERWERAVRDKEEGRGRFGRGTGAVSAPNAPAPAAVKPESEESADRTVFDRFIRAKQDLGEDVSRLTFERFRELLGRERDKLKEKTGKTDWEFDVAADAGKVRLAVRPGMRKSV
jgi:hypothetical protein